MPRQKKSNGSQPVRVPPLTVENARIGFRNFSGKEGPYNKAGNRNFCVFLETEIAEELASHGWNIKWLVPRDPEDERQAYLQVSVSYSNYPPKITTITSSGQTILDEDTIHVLDWADISMVDLIITPYSWEVNKKTGIKAYVRKMYITLEEDELEKKYRNVPDASRSSDHEYEPFEEGRD